MRIITWNFASQKDASRFPANEIAASSNPFSFHISDSMAEFFVDRPSKMGFQSMPLDQFLNNSKAHLAFMVIKNDTIVYEHYREGINKNKQLTYFSVSKSILSILVGMALEEGAIHSVDDPITDYIPLLREKQGFEQITIEHLLKHTSGIRFRETYANPFSNDVAKIYYSKSLERLVKNLKLEYPPDEQFHYSSVNSQLLGLVLREAIGKPLAQYMEEKIWKPVGAANPASWSTYEKEPIEKTFCCVNAAPIDLAKFGRLALNKGNWEGDQLVSEEWFEQSLERSVEGGSVWRYQWHWIVGLKEYGDFMAQGLYDQYIYLMPKKNIIIVSVNDFHNPKTYWTGLFRQLVDQL